MTTIFPVRRAFRLVMALSLCLACCFSCTSPTEADFGTASQGLRDDEMLWVLRISRTRETLPAQSVPSLMDSIRYQIYNHPIFESGLPAVLQGLADGKILAYEDYAFTESERPIQDLNGLLASMNTTMQDYTPFVQICELVCVVDLRPGNFSSRAVYLRMYWRDPEHKLADRPFACIRFADLDDSYKLRTSAGEYPLREYLQRDLFVGFPVYIRTNSNEYTPKSQEEALHVMDMVRRGNGTRIAWIGDAVNITGKQPIKLPVRQLRRYEGAWQFPGSAVGGDSLTDEELFLSREEDHFIADWSHRFRIDKLYPFDSTSFFSPGGDMYYFLEDTARNQQLLFISAQNDSAYSYLYLPTDF